jgi:hypothetical protein
MVRTKENTWAWLTYVYGDDQRETKSLIGKGFFQRNLTIDLSGRDLGYVDTSTTPPSRAYSAKISYKRSAFDCGSCHFHSSANGFITQQLNKGSQFADLFSKGVLSKMPNPAVMEAGGQVTSWSPLDDSTATLAHKSISYLAAQCSHCHMGFPERNLAGFTSNFRYFKKETMVQKSFSTEFIRPGFPDTSQIINMMMNKTKPPFICLPDAAGIKVLWQWMNALSDGITPFPGAPVN